MIITEFLEARIAEDETVAREATTGPWTYQDYAHVGSYDFAHVFAPDPDDSSAVLGVSLGTLREDAAHIARHDPARVLAECAAKRAIIALDEYAEGSYWDTLATLAAVYASHPDYRQEWAIG